MDNAYEYLNEKNVLLEEKRMLDVEKHKNVGADMISLDCYIDDLIDDMDNISDMKDVIEKKN